MSLNCSNCESLIHSNDEFYIGDLMHWNIEGQKKLKIDEVLCPSCFKEAQHQVQLAILNNRSAVEILEDLLLQTGEVETLIPHFFVEAVMMCHLEPELFSANPQKVALRAFFDNLNDLSHSEALEAIAGLTLNALGASQ